MNANHRDRYARGSGAVLKSLIHRLVPRSYVTDRHGTFSCWAIGLGACGAALVVTMRPILALDVFRRIRADDFSTGLARLSWYVRCRFPKADMSVDPMYLPCSGMTPPELEAMRRFLKRHGGSIRPETLLGEYCFLSASAAIATFGTPDHEIHMNQLHLDADALLGRSLGPALAEPPAPAASGKPPAAIASRSGFSRDKAEAALRDGFRLLEEAGFRPFILSGTLLGAIREGHILDHDYDIDLGLFADETDLSRLEERLYHSPPFRCLCKEYQTLVQGEPEAARRRDVPVVYKLRHDNGIIIDIFLHYREGDGVWHGTALYRWENSPFTLVPHDLAGIRVAVPSNAEQNLSENYGDWRKPARGFNCAVDTPNLVLHPGPMSLAAAVRRLALLSSRPKDAARLLEQMAAAGLIEPDPERGWRISRTGFPAVPVQDLREGGGNATSTPD